jgi:hypothetical protein
MPTSFTRASSESGNSRAVRCTFALLGRHLAVIVCSFFSGSSGHLLLGAAQQERAQRLGQQRAVGLLGAVAVLAERGKRGGSPEHARVQELVQRPQLAEVVLDGRAGQCQTVLGVSSRLALAACGVVILDRLRFVQHRVVEADVLQRTISRRSVP